MSFAEIFTQHAYPNEVWYNFQQTTYGNTCMFPSKLQAFWHEKLDPLF